MFMFKKIAICRNVYGDTYVMIMTNDGTSKMSSRSPVWKNFFVPLMSIKFMIKKPVVTKANKKWSH